METQERSVEDRIADVVLGPEEVIEESPPEPEPVEAADDTEEVEASAEVEEDAGEAEAAEDGGEPEFVEVEIDGKLYEVPVELKDSVLRQSDYTKKTQEVAEQRKAVEVQLGEIERQRAQYQFAQEVQPDLLKAQQLEQQADQAHQYLRENIDSLSSTDIEKIRLAVDEARRERDQIVQSLQQKTNEFQQAQEQSRAELLNKGTEVLRSRIPEWGESHVQQVRDFALSNGFSEAELDTVVDPRQVEVLWKAAQYDALRAGKAAAVQKVQAAPTIKPKARNPMPEETKRYLNTRKKLKSNSLDAKQKAKVIQENIADRLKL